MPEVSVPEELSLVLGFPNQAHLGSLPSIDGAIQAFDGGWPVILQDQLDVHQDPENSLLQVGVREGMVSWWA